MPLEFDGTAFDRIGTTLTTLNEFDAYPLMDQWASILVEGNRRGVLSGKDGFNNTVPLKYRTGAGKPTRNRRVPNYGTTKHGTSGFGPYASGLNDNLSSAEYQELTGPRLAPRGEASRVIKNLHTAIQHFPDLKRWEAIGAWDSVVSSRGVPFLPYHFEGAGRLPRYDLRPVRPEDVQFCANALEAFVRRLFNESL